jgi:hypothetical protein
MRKIRYNPNVTIRADRSFSVYEGFAMSTGFVDAVIHDMRYALRSLHRNWNFTAAAVPRLPGIGATTTIFGALDTI